MSSKCLMRAARAVARSATRVPRTRLSATNATATATLRHARSLTRAFSTAATEDTSATVAPTAATDVSANKRGTTKHSFQTETRQILDIVTHSLYTDKEVFLRELISNASDALEKARYHQSNNSAIIDNDKEFEVRIEIDKEKKTLTIIDTGIGMTQDELISHLGTIARSGSKAFLNNLKSSSSSTSQASATSTDASNIIGQFGVGFYSTFMVGDKVEVLTQSALNENGSPSYHWVSDGSGEYEISEIDRQPRGTKIIVHLKEQSLEYLESTVLETIIKKYSNFVSFPIYLNGARINTVGAIWSRPKDSVTEEEHADFYKYYANAYDTPLYRYHFTVDAPIAIQALFYVPSSHMEKYGMGRLEPGTSLYSRRILISPKSKTILPEFLRFIKGVVDSEDLPLNISRESMQDTKLLTRMNKILTKKILKFFEDESVKNPTKYAEFYNEYQNFLKEGACAEFEWKKEISRLLRFDSSINADSRSDAKLISFDDYISRMMPNQQKIYYLCAPSKSFAVSSPYYENYKAKGLEVMFLYSNPLDEFVMQHLGDVNGRKLVNVESEASEESSSDSGSLSKESQDRLIGFISDTLREKVASVKVSSRLHTSPALIVNTESVQFRKMMKYVEQTSGAGTSDSSSDFNTLTKQKLEINANHPIMTKLLKRVERGDAKSLEVARLVTEQVFDNACVAADLIDNPRIMMNRLNALMLQALDSESEASAGSGSDRGTEATNVQA